MFDRLYYFMEEIKEILRMPTVIDNNHESLYRSYHILKYVMKMVERGDTKQTIVEVENFLNNSPEKSQ